MDGQQIDTLPDIPRAAESKEPFLQPMDVHDSSEDGCIDPLPSDSNISGLLKKPVMMLPLPAPDRSKNGNLLYLRSRALRSSNFCLSHQLHSHLGEFRSLLFQTSQFNGNWCRSNILRNQHSGCLGHRLHGLHPRHFTPLGLIQ
jgi:hypothetical protein